MNALESRISSEYYKFLDSFGEQIANTLPYYHTINYIINTIDSIDTL
jgi:hypothetical protein